MTVTGSNWQSLTLGKLIPTLDPNKPGSAANRLNCEVGKISAQIDNNLKKVTNLTDSVANTLDVVNNLGTQIAVLQNQIEDLITNAINTGVYMHTLGLNPIFSLTSPGAISEEIARTFTDPDDPNKPVFKGNGLATIGGMLLLVSAPNVQEMIAAIERLGTIFPVFRTAIESIVSETEKTADIFSDKFFDPTMNSISNLGTAFANLQAKDLYSPQPFTDLYDQAVYDTSVAEFDGFETRLFARWYALRLSDLIPALNPSLPGSPAEAIANAERAVVGGGAALLQQAGGLANSVRELSQAVNFLNRRLQEVATSVQNLVTAVSQTGLFVHLIGLDGTVTSSDQFIGACSRALGDITDPNRPRAAGEMQAFAGLEIVFGAANPVGLNTQFKVIGNVFSGVITSGKKIGF